MVPLFQDLIDRLDNLPAPPGDLRDGFRMAVDIAGRDPEMALTRSRKVLERVVRDVYERRIKEPPGTRPLENLLQRLVKDGYLPTRLEAYANTVRMLGNVGAHRFGESVGAEDVHRSLTQLIPVIEWYVLAERPAACIPRPGAPLPPGAVNRSAPRPEGDARAAFKFTVVPKGLRSFDAGDALFFLELLPGPRDEDGLPESVRFWKRRIEAADELTFTVGVLYGPSGCGKSSLLRAGLLPRLGPRVLSVYVEATADDTETRLLKGLRKRCPDLPGDLDLPASFAALRQGTGLSEGRKVLVALDQFEQWLHANRPREDLPLIQALRQCDGERVQCVVLVRDDFWLAVSRFMKALDVRLVEGQNSALVDLFDLPHARKVLAAFGRSFGRLPENLVALPREHERFLDQSVAGLAQDGRVISVRLALFAEMVKGKPWTPATLKAVGGMEGVGVSFLEETFGAAAPPEHRLHQRGIVAVLKALLPEIWTEIKGHMRSHQELLEASGYVGRPWDFEGLLRILDGELRLITPTDREGANADSGEPPEGQSGEKFYQLTHDYLVPSVREWLIRKQKESRQGRAELRLAVWSSVWNTKQEDRNLPSWWEWVSILLLTKKKGWAPPQRKMMRKAARRHGVRGAVLAVLLAAASLVGWSVWGRVVEQSDAEHAYGLVHGLLGADIDKVADLVTALGPYRRWADPRLRQADAEAERDRDSGRRLRASLDLLPADPGQVDYLYGRLLDAGPQEVGVIRQGLSDAGHGQELTERLWQVVGRPEKGREVQRLRAACALAGYAPEDSRWGQATGPVVEQLVSVNPVFLGLWMEGLRPVRKKLLGPLAAVFRDRKEERTEERSLATSILADYAAEQSEVLADLVQDADEKQFAVLFPKLETHRERVAAVMGETVAASLESRKTDEEKERLAKRQANAAVVLLRLGQADRVWPLLKHRPDPRVRSYLIHRLSPLGADPEVIIKRLVEEKDVSIRRALLLCLGEFSTEQFPLARRESLIPQVVRWHRDDPDPGLHGAADWLLRQWGQEGILNEMNEDWRKDRQRRVERWEQIKQERAKGNGSWYVNGQGQTMTVIAGPVTFLMGSPPTEAGRDGGPEGKMEKQHTKRISRSFVVAAKEVTVEQFLRFRKDFPYNQQYSSTPDCPVNRVTWYDAAAYCNWLSDQEGIPREQWCYLRNPSGEYAEGMKPAPDYLSRTGYRLPSEAEWEYACRAGAATSRYYGETEELLGKYAWYTKNSQDRGTLPGRFGVSGGCLKPNDLGLFDMLGNAVEWCQEHGDYYTEDLNDVEDGNDVRDNKVMVYRGGSFGYLPVFVRSAYRYWLQPTFVDYTVGFRPARTLP